MNAPIDDTPSAPRRAVSPRLAELRTQLTGDDAVDQQIVHDFWGSVGSQAPLVEPIAGRAESAVTFLWRDDRAKSVYVAVNKVTNDLAGAQLRLIPGTDIWFATFLLDATWRGSYTFLSVSEPGQETLEALEPRWAMRHIRERGVCDPRNSARVLTHAGLQASVAAGPLAPTEALLDAIPARPGTGTELISPTGRKVWLHEPSESASSPRPLVLALDGQVWDASGYAAQSVDNLPGPKPLVAMIDVGSSKQRMADLSIDGSMSEELVSEILPWLRRIRSISQRPADIIVSGESLGGLTALKTAFDHPTLVGAALSQSASLWQHDMIERATSSKPVSIFLTVGAHENVLLEPHRRLVAALSETRHQSQYQEFFGGHDMACWRGWWGVGVRQLLAAANQE